MDYSFSLGLCLPGPLPLGWLDYKLIRKHIPFKFVKKILGEPPNKKITFLADMAFSPPPP